MYPKHPVEPLVSLDGLWLTLDSHAGPIDILRGISLDVARQESVSITGPSGAGKTSLMMIIGGLEKPTRGEIRVAGLSLGDLSEDALANYRRRNVGIVFQAYHLIPTMNALENVAIPLELAGADGAFERAGADLERVGLGHRLKHYPDQLSGGEQQRVALARALILKPSLVLADEPTGNLDRENSAMVMDLIFDLAEASQTTLVLITHQQDLAARCDRNISMLDGEIVADSRRVA